MSDPGAQNLEQLQNTAGCDSLPLKKKSLLSKKKVWS